MTDESTAAPKSDAASTSEKILEQAEGLIDQAKVAIGDALDTTISAVKEHPIAAASIAAGAAAAVAGAVIGAGKLLQKDEPTPAKKK